jgi:hypothetical protein
MPISGTSIDYSTRKKDIHIFQNVDVNKIATIAPSFGRISNYCAGIQKLVQRYTIALLTAIESQPAYPSFGTNLLTKLSNTNLTIDKTKLTHIFNFANYSVIKSFRTYQSNTEGLPLDEQLDTAILQSITVTNGVASLSIQLFPVQQTAVTFLIPLPKT